MCHSSNGAAETKPEGPIVTSKCTGACTVTDLAALNEATIAFDLDGTVSNRPPT
jgi:hypothetical protein